MAAKTVQLAVTQRSELGSRANKRLRDAGFIPGVVYGHKEQVVSITLPKKELNLHLRKGVHVFNLELSGKNETVLVKEVQFDHLGDEVLHVDFNRVRADERVKVTVPLELKGTPKGEADGGVLTQVIANLEVECLVLEIPEIIRHHVGDMELDSVLHIKDIKLPEGVRVLQDGDQIVATVKEVLEAAAVAAVVEEGAAEPEIIGRKAGEVGEEGAAGEAAAGKEKK